MSSAELDHLCHVTGVDDAIVRSKSMEYLRRVEAKGIMRTMPMDRRSCVVAVCFELACDSNRRYIERNKLVKSLGMKSITYKKTLASLKIQLGIANFVTFDLLVVKFNIADSTRLLSLCHELLQKFQKALGNSLINNNNGAVTTTDEYPCAIFYICVQMNGGSQLSLKRIADSVGITLGNLQRVVTLIKQLCPDLQQSTPTKAKGTKGCLDTAELVDDSCKNTPPSKRPRRDIGSKSPNVVVPTRKKILPVKLLQGEQKTVERLRSTSIEAKKLSSSPIKSHHCESSPVVSLSPKSKYEKWKSEMLAMCAEKRALAKQRVTSELTPDNEKDTS